MASDRKCVILVPVYGSPVPDCDDRLRALEARGYPVWRVRGHSAIDAARCQMATDALAQGYDELFWIDSDVVFEPDDVDRLRRHGLPFVCGLYPKKGARQFAAAFLPGMREVPFGAGGKLLEIQWCGFGFTLTHRTVYEAIRHVLQLPMCNEWAGKPLLPYFWPTVAETAPGSYWYLAEDYAFCARARHAGIPIHADTAIRLWHVGSYHYGWEDAGRETERYTDYTLHLPPEQPPQTGFPRLAARPTHEPSLPPAIAPTSSPLTDRSPSRRQPAPNRPDFALIRAYLVAHPSNQHAAETTAEELRRSDWSELATIINTPAATLNGPDLPARIARHGLDAAAADGCHFALFLAPGARISPHFRRDLLAIPALRDDLCDLLVLNTPTEDQPTEVGRSLLLSRWLILATLARWTQFTGGFDHRLDAVCQELAIPTHLTQPALIKDHPPTAPAR